MKASRSSLELNEDFDSLPNAVSKAVMNFTPTGNFGQLAIGKTAKLVFEPSAVSLVSEIHEAVGATTVFSGLQCKECNFHCEGFLHGFEHRIKTDVLAAYFSLIEEAHIELKHPPCTKTWRKHILRMKGLFDKCELVRRAKRSGINEACESLDHFVKPAFLSSFITLSPPAGAKLLANYNIASTGAGVSIYSVPGAAEKFYLLHPPEVRVALAEAGAMGEALDAMTRREAEVVDPLTARNRFKQLALDLLDEDPNATEFADIVTRYSAGYGLLELFLTDDQVQDLYVDSPGDSPLYVYHSKFEECIANVQLTKLDLERLGSRLRAVSARPFDESSPVINTEISELGVRVCGLCPPATFAGFGFAFRKHRPAPWTLSQFIAARMIDSRTAGLLSFLVDGQRSLLITGPRGSGKSSFLAALIAEVSPLYRMVVIEDTPELPVDALRAYGHKVQHLRIKASIGSDGDVGGLELSAEEALRTALRLGESVLVLGEVRGPEARSLFEAMRVGAAGNVVMGTIHGSSAYDTWDRIVNDLHVPSTSFKATDAVISLASVRRGDESRRYRRLVSLTEVRKHWRQDPFHENGFNDLVSFNVASDAWSLNLRSSALIEDIAKLKRFKKSDVEKNIACRTSIKELLVDRAKKLSLPSLLEVQATIDSNNEYARLVAAQVEEHGSVNYTSLLSSYAKWLASYCKSLQR